jgi:hypothetical protein
MSTTRYFPLDIESAKIYGITKWQKDFFWPVSYQSYKEIETQIKQALNKLIQDNINNELSELLLINYKIFLEYANFLYSLWVLKEVYRNGLTPLYGGSSINFKGIIENGIPLKRILSAPSIDANSFIKQIRAKVTSAKVNWALSKSLTAFLKKPLKPADFITDPSLISGSLLPEYIRRRLNGRIRLKATQDWYSMSAGIRLSQNQKDKIDLLCKNLVQQVEQIAIGYDLKLTKLQYKYLADITVELLLPTMICLEALKKYISSLKPLHLFVGSSGNHFARMLSLAVRANGGRVTGFKHGEPAIYLSDYYSWLELSTADRFMTYTEHSARAIESVGNIYPALRANQVKIEGAATRIFYDLWQKESKKPLPKKIERVMVIAKNLKFDNKISYGQALPQLMQIDLELRLVNILKKSGYTVIYKLHPDSNLHSDVLDFFDSKVQVVYEPLEEVMNYPDAFLFYHSNSTTFGPALCTNKPIIYINAGWEVWLPQVYELIAKRCRIVSANFDQRNRLIVNEEELLDALAGKPLEPDLEFANSYMFH